MGKKGRKTRWRTLTITDEHSDSEESNTTTSGYRVSKGYPQKSFYNRFTYSSQSTPTRRYQCDGTKSTRSSSTASENKITFNEDEYTRITTPRQDVLFKKGYLNKPKTYQTQTSTGNSTTSTGNSTGNGTPDHQSTDLEYESQFVFPNGFVDQNGIYYVNSFEPYPLMVFNPPTYYPDFTNIKSKRCSTGSLTESTSPNNEETSQDLSQSETPNCNNVSDFNHVYNVIYPGFYFNGACQPQDVANHHHHHQPEPRRMKKKRRRKLSRSKSLQEATTSEYTDESSDEVFSDHHQQQQQQLSEKEAKEESTSAENDAQNEIDPKKNETEEKEEAVEEMKKEEEETAAVVDAQKLLMNGLIKDNHEDSIEEEEEEKDEEGKNEETKKIEEVEELPKKYDLKPDAEEFVPRAYRQTENTTIPQPPAMEQPPPPPTAAANVQFIKIPPNFVPLPIINHPLTSDFNGTQNYNTAFIPPGIPINFIPQNYINYIPSSYVKTTDNNVQIGDKQQQQQLQPQQQQQQQQQQQEKKEKVEVKDEEKAAVIKETTVEVPKNQIDIAKIVSKLEEAAKEQDGVVKTAEKETGSATRKMNGSGRFLKRNRYCQKVETKATGGEEEEEKKKTVWKPPSPKKEAPQAPGPLPPNRILQRNYSDTLKKPQTTGAQAQTQCERHEKHMERLKVNVNTDKPAVVVKNHVKVESPSVKTSNQWISVSNRKKRKNKNVEETEEFEEATVKEEIEKEEEEAVVSENGVLPKLTVPEEVPEVPKPVKSEEAAAVVEAKEEKTKPATKKKAKKGGNGQKSNVKRVIIKDVDLMSKEVVEKTTVVKDEKPLEEVAEKVPEAVVEATVPPEEVKEEEVVVEPTVEEKVPLVVVPPEDKVEEVLEERTPEKKSAKKKKKKVVKSVLAGSQSSSSTTLNVLDDSYDFLLESSLLDESSKEKTNVEVSQELDKMIQRGMYSSLEEKIKRLNIEPSDNFFKTIIHNISNSRESSVEKNSLGKTPDFGRLLNSSASSNLLKSAPAMGGVDLKKLGDFLGETTPKQPGTLVGGEEKTKLKNEENEEDSDKLYPITKAVKEWMTKTRETTPEVEIFKSPSAIFREFSEAKNGDGNSLSAGLLNGGSVTGVEDGVTVCSFRGEGEEEEDEEDLMEYWEDPKVVEKKKSSSSVEEAEDVLEEYESKYGQNEDYLKIKKEVEELGRGSLPKHGNLPYRAICCSIM